MSIRTPLVGCLAPVLIMFSSQTLALPFGAMDPYSFSMGGTGVASGTRANAAFYNPALLATLEQDDRYSVQLPLGYRQYDRDKVHDALNTYQDSLLEQNYDTALNNFKTGNYGDGGTLATAQQEVFDRTALLRNQLELLVEKPMHREFLGGVVVGIPHEKLAMSLVVDVRMVGGAVINVTDNDLDELQRIMDDLNNGSLSTAETFDSTQFTSAMQGRGVTLTEFKLSVAQERDLFGYKMAFGITPKYIQATSFDYATPGNLDTAEFDASLGQWDSDAFDIDVGAAKRYGNGWSTGASIINLIGQKYDTVLGNQVKVNPQARLGVSHTTEWTLVALDLDLNEANSTGFDSKTQYLAIGAELDVFDMINLRIGYRHNMSDTATSIATAGIGMEVFGAQLDLAVGANEDEIDLSAQLGVWF